MPSSILLGSEKVSETFQNCSQNRLPIVRPRVSEQLSLWVAILLKDLGKSSY